MRILDEAKKVVNDGLAKRVAVRCSEPDATNYGHLEQVAEGLAHDQVTVKATQDTFEEVAQGFIRYAAGEATPPPTFVMVDPYGVRGVKLETLKRLLAFDRVEVLLTFMVRDPARFLREENYAQPLTELFGGEAWRACEEVQGAKDRAECLMRTFRDVVVPDVAEYALSFEVYEDERQTLLYYLVHLTNKDLGMRVMKEAMVKRRGEMAFYPITIRPEDQIAFDVAEPAPYPTLQEHLLNNFAGQTLTYRELLNKDYPTGLRWIDGNYSKALQAMESAAPPTAEVRRVEPKTKTGKKTKKIILDDEVVFSGAVPLS